MIYTILILIALLAHGILLALSCLYVYGYYRNRKDLHIDFQPNATVIVPCKANEQNLQQNLEAICTQHYPKYTVLFILDSEHDTAYPIISNVAQKMKNSTIVLSTKLDGCSGKISALITGIHNAKDAIVYVFADSDIRPHDQWLSYLVAGLTDERVGATTGYRWYFPRDWKSSLISTWNMATISGLFNPFSTSAWGGSTAIRKSLFEKLQIESIWKKGFSDDLLLTSAVKKAGYHIKFNPKCLVESPSETNMKKFLRWSSGQFTWVRWYTPLGWFIPFLGLLSFTSVPIIGLIALGIGWTIPGALMVSILLMEMIYGGVGIMTLKRTMGYPQNKTRFAYRYALLMPIAFLLYTYNMLVSSVKKQILWGGRTYQKKDARP